jgi:UDP-N-acetylglucosamine 2-epimerase (non-hydrolysing)
MSRNSPAPASRAGDQPTIHVFLGTKAQYIKTAPLLRLLDARGLHYRLIDTGQHTRLTASMRTALGVRTPDVQLGGGDDIATIPRVIRWWGAIAARLWSGRRIRRQIFGNLGGVCVVHGDTPSSLLAALLARRAGVPVAHLEAGLRSHSLVHPFPEEAIRIVVMRLSELLFAPDDTAMANLAAMRVKGRVVALTGNTISEALDYSLPAHRSASGPAVVTMHRVENLTSRRRVKEFVEIVGRLAAATPVRFVMHAPTEKALTRFGMHGRLIGAGIQTSGLLPHDQFVQMLANAPLVITDGGSIQEECARLGVPTLLWRARTERPDGIGANVVLSRYDAHTVATFVEQPERYRRQRATERRRPSEQILDELLAFISRHRAEPSDMRK